MRKGFFPTIPALLTSAGLAFCQQLVAAEPNAVVPAAAASRVVRASGADADNAFGPEQEAHVQGNAFDPEATHASYEAPRVPGVGDTTSPECCIFYASGEYIHLWTKQSRLPLLVTTSPSGAAPILNSGDTHVLIGGTDVPDRERTGGRFAAEYWLDPNSGLPFGVEAAGFVTGTRSSQASVGSDSTGSPVIGRPVGNVLDGTETVLFVSSPGQFAGTVSVATSSSLWGAEANILIQSGSAYQYPDLFVGFRYLNLEDSLAIGETTTLLTGTSAGPSADPTASPSVVTISDRFSSRNEFMGGQFGARYEYDANHFFFNFKGKIGVGVTHESVSINGTTTNVTQQGASTTFVGGLLALPSNGNHPSRDQFSVVPEAGVNIGYHISKKVDVFAGYNILYWSDVARASDQVDRTVNPTQVPSSLTFGQARGASRPTNPFTQTDFWAHGVNLGLAFKY